jgi:hypothetical protein
VSGLHKAVEPFSGAADRANQQHNARSASSWRRSRWQAGQPCPPITPADCGQRPTRHDLQGERCLRWDLFSRAEQQIGVLVYAANFLHEQYPALYDLLREKAAAESP